MELNKVEGLNITSTHYLPANYLTKNKKTIEEIIKATYKRTRGMLIELVT